MLGWDWLQWDPKLSFSITYLAAGNPLEGSGGSAGALVTTSWVWHSAVLVWGHVRIAELSRDF